MLKQIAFLLRYLRYLIKSRHYNGHGIHSPFIYKFSREVLFSKSKIHKFKSIELIVDNLKKNEELIYIEDYGAGSRIFKTNKRRVKDIAKVSSTKKKYGELLYRLVEYFGIKNIIELGTSLGVGTMYLALSGKSKIYTIEGDLQTYKKAKESFINLGLDNVTSVHGLFDNVLKDILKETQNLDLVYFDGNHQMQATIDYFELCLTKISNNSIFIFDDIHWSKGMECAWSKIKTNSKTMVTIDLFQMGIVFFNKELSKEHYVIRY